MRGSEVTLECRVKSMPKPTTFGWYNLTRPSHSIVDCTNRSSAPCSLTLTNIDVYYSGTYQCLADNKIKGSPVRLNKTITIYGLYVLPTAHARTHTYARAHTHTQSLTHTCIQKHIQKHTQINTGTVETLHMSHHEKSPLWIQSLEESSLV